MLDPALPICGRVGEFTIGWLGTKPIFGVMLMLIGGGGGLPPFVLFVLMFRFFLKSLIGSSGPSILPISLFECSNCVCPSYEFLASLRLLILGVIF